MRINRKLGANDELAQAILNEFNVYCSNKDQGCVETMKLGYLK